MQESIQNITQAIKNKLRNFNSKNDDLFFLIGNFKHLEKSLTLDQAEVLNQTFKVINKILANAFNKSTLGQDGIFELLQEVLYIEQLIASNKDASSNTNSNERAKNNTSSNNNANNNNDTFKKVAIGLGLGVLGFAVGKAFMDANRSSKSLENEDILTVAYYLSRYNHDYLFDKPISAAKAIENIAGILGLKPNTLRNKRDYFDAFLAEEGIETESQRKGYHNAAPSKQYSKIIDKYRESNEEEVRGKTMKILNNY